MLLARGLSRLDRDRAIKSSMKKSGRTWSKGPHACSVTLCMNGLFGSRVWLKPTFRRNQKGLCH
eukprot:6771943-Prorocentrum_lima.AAC.1